MLDISPALLLVTASVFLILLIALNKMLYKPLLGFIDNRNDTIKRDLENAGQNVSDVDAYFKEADAILLVAKEEASKIREVALEKAKEIATKEVAQKKSELDDQYLVFLKTLEIEQVQLKKSLSLQIPLFQESIKAKLSQI
ncbi:MAG: F0F1 ATP synthase subunit B' [Sulfurospirillum sp.]|nr:F0F1 ATP synthase subunit B' [Sulfurospirillum sp.]